MFSKIELPLHIDIISPCLSPLSSNNNEKFRGFARSDISPKKIDQEIYDFWYPEAKKYMRQVFL